MGQFVGQDTFVEILEGQVDGAGTDIVKGLQEAIAEKARTLARHEKYMALSHLFAVRQQNNVDSGCA
jgi:hypothetical protein